MIGVKEESIYNWENNRCSPSLHVVPKIIRFLDYVPHDTSTMSLGERVVAARHTLGLKQEELAHKLGVTPTR